jgi:predicted  nucleic acid-binding Zn-ribbon protein
MLSGVPGQWLEQYKFLKGKRNGTAVAPAAEGFCQACHMQIPPQLYNELQRNDHLIACPSCHRILYFGPHHDLKP